jgi:putative hydrolase of the HAD superfamily
MRWGAGLKRIVLLDFGGTLDGDGLHWSVQFAEAFGAAGADVAPPMLREAFLASDRALLTAPGIDALGLDGHVGLQVSRMLDHLDISCAATAEAISRYWLDKARARLARARRSLADHRARFRYGIVSNFTGNLPLILREEGLADMLDCVIVSETERTRKPEPAIFRLALQRMGATAEEAAMVGDSLPADIAGAKAVGLTTVWVHGDPAPAGDKPPEADFAVRDVPAALELLAAA